MTNPPKDSSDSPEEPDPTSKKDDATSGKPDATSGKPDATSGKPDATSGKPDATSGEPGAAKAFAPPGAPYAEVHGRVPYGPPPAPPAYPPIPYKPTKIEKVFTGWKKPTVAMSPALVAGAAVAGVIGAVTLGPALRSWHLGVGAVIAAVAVAYVAGASAWSAGRLVPAASAKGGGRWRFNRTGVAFILLALGLSTTAAFRDAGWITVPALLLAVAIGSYGTSGGRSWAEVLGGGFAVLPAACRAIPWAVLGVYRAAASGRGNAWPIVRTGMIAAGLVAVFGGLFVGADAAFESIASELIPDIEPATVVLYGFVGCAVMLLASGGAFLAQAPPPLRILDPKPAKPAGRWSWAVPIAALDLLFVVFCAIQAGVFLASDKDELLRSTGLTYAEYARQGFFQLLFVTVLVLVVLAVAVRYAPSARRADRVTVRVLLGVLCALTLVVVAVALRRLYLYEEAFGWTRLRLWVHAFELWLGFVVVLAAVAGVVKGRFSWLPRAAAASGAVAMIVLASINPDGFIAEHNVARFQDTGKIDIDYLENLSADAVPALDRLPEPQRSCALHFIAYDLEDDEPAMVANHSRERAREILDRRPLTETVTCQAGSFSD